MVPRSMIAKKLTAYRVVPALVALGLFVTFSVAYMLGDQDTYLAILRLYGIIPFKTPFLDISSILATWECTRLGVDVFVRDPCDLLGRVFIYSPFWLTGSFVPLGVSATVPVGWILDLIFLMSLTLLPPVRRRWELVLVVLATISTMVVFAVERAHPDIILFMLALLTGFLALGPLAARLLAYFVIVFAASLKYYPLTLLILSFRERVATFFSINLIMAALIALFVVVYLPDLEREIPLIPSSVHFEVFFGDMFGAKNLPIGLTEFVIGQSSAASPTFLSFDLVSSGLYGILVLSAALSCWWLLTKTPLRPALSQLARHENIFLLIGSALVVGCFFAGQSVGYRGIYLLLVLPGLLALARDTAHTTLRKLSIGAAGVLVWVMWGECFRRGLMAQLHMFKGTATENLLWVIFFLFWLARELAWWWLVSIMTAILIDFLAKSETVGGLLEMWRRYRSLRGKLKSTLDPGSAAQFALSRIFDLGAAQIV